MKQIPALLLLGFALSFCGLTDKLKSMKSTSNSNSNSGPSSSSSGDGITAEKAEPTAAQTAALAGGSSLSWDQQGMSWSLPPTWTKVSDERNSLVAQSPGGENAGHLIVSISPMAEDFPMVASIKAFYDGAKTRQKNSEVDEVKWLEIGGVKGVEFRESNPDKPDGIRRLQWLAYRKYNGQVQMVNVMLSSSGKGFPEHEDAMRGVLYSTKLSH
jgi:hypothetical protein